jgi:hypothetical protein
VRYNVIDNPLAISSTGNGLLIPFSELPNDFKNNYEWYIEGVNFTTQTNTEPANFKVQVHDKGDFWELTSAPFRGALNTGSGGFYGLNIIHSNVQGGYLIQCFRRAGQNLDRVSASAIYIKIRKIFVEEE